VVYTSRDDLHYIMSKVGTKVPLPTRSSTRALIPGVRGRLDDGGATGTRLRTYTGTLSRPPITRGRDGLPETNFRCDSAPRCVYD
jgi:hypothetical protein